MVKMNGIEHVGIPVTALARSEAFYGRLGFVNAMAAKCEYKGGRGRVAMMRRGASMQPGAVVLELYQMQEGELVEIRAWGNGHIDEVGFDRDVLISAIVYLGRPAEVRQLFALDDLMLVTSEVLLRELDRILSDKFGWPPERVALAKETVRCGGATVSPEMVMTDCIGPAGNRVLEAAVACSAVWIVRGDKDLLRMGEFQGVRIVTPAQFLLRMDVAEVDADA